MPPSMGKISAFSANVVKKKTFQQKRDQKETIFLKKSL